MMLETAAPSVRTRRKHRLSEADEQRALLKAAFIWRDTPVTVQVVARGRVVGEVCGDPSRGRTLITSGYGPFTSYDNAITRTSAGTRWAQYWCKLKAAAAVANNWYDLWGVDGNPPAGNWSGTARTARQFSDATTGAMYHGGTVSPAIKSLNRSSLFTVDATTAAHLLYDRVLSYDACTMTAGTQNMTNTLGAQRYNAGAPAMQIFLEADSIHSGTAANLTGMSYSDEFNNSGTVLPTPLTKIVSVAAPSGTLGARSIIATPGSSTLSSGPYLPLAAATVGCRSIQNYTFSAAPTGTFSAVLQFPYALFTDSASDSAVSDYEYSSGVEAVNRRVYDGACLAWMYYAINTPAAMTHGWTEMVW